MIYSSIKYIRDGKLLEAEKLTEQNTLDLNNRMEQCENSLIYLAANYSLQQFLQMDTGNYMELREAAGDIGPLLYNVLLSNQYYKRLRIYADKDFILRKDLIKNSSEVCEETWYKETLETTDTCWWYEDGKIWISRKIAVSYPKKTVGVLFAELKENLLDGSFNIFEQVPVRILLNEKQEIYRGEKWTNGYFSETRELLPEGWKISYEIDRGYFYPGTWVSLAFPAAVIFSVILAAGIVVRIVLKLLVKEVEELVDKVREVDAGNLNMELEPLKTEELNILVGGINDMLARIRQLIQKVYQDEAEQKELELEVLRAKISPHFLYNNLSAINWLAIERGQDDIYEITTQMATFYRTALNKGRKSDRLQLEITNIQAYLRLQLISHENSFDVIYEIDPSTLEYIVPTFILQPLVENALEHGTDLLRDRRGRIVIRAYCREEALWLEVEDNGKALYERIGDNLMDIVDYGYGTGNVHRRIQLVYGEKYGLTIRGSKEGTIARLRLKIDEIGVAVS